MHDLQLPFLETMITQVCNLACEGCTNYSDLKHKGYVPWSQGKDWLQDWLEKIEIKEFGIMGGEPLINPEWQDWLQGVRFLLPDSRIRFTTNGLLLSDASDTLDFCENLGNITFKITVHLDDQLLESTIKDLLSQRQWTPVTEYGIHRWAGPNGLRFQVNRPDTFLKTFQNSYNNMLPWNSNPVDAFNACCQQTCPLLHEGRIYKCSTAGLLKSVLDRFDKPNWDQWQPYIDSGIDPQDSSEKIFQFINNFGKPNSICGQCPSSKVMKINHLNSVIKK